MKEEQNSIQRMCAFYVSDYHFEMISLPYILQNLEKKRKVIILTENNLEKSINTLVSKMILKEEKKNKILEIKWNHDDLNKIEEIKNIINNEKIIVFIKGKEKYINNINEKLKKFCGNNSKIEIVDCYDAEEISDKMDKIIENYKNVLNTEGKKEIQGILKT